MRGKFGSVFGRCQGSTPMLHLNPLPLRVPLGDREVAFSYMSRLAQRNGLRMADFAIDLKLPLLAVAYGETRAVDDLAALAGVPADAMKGWTPAKVNGSAWTFRDEPVPRLALQLYPVRGCPVCLREDAAAAGPKPGEGMFLRGHWLFSHVTLCHRHGHPLVGLWSELYEWRRHDAFQCLKDVAPRVLEGALDRPPRPATAFDLWLEDRLATGRKTHWLDGFDLYAACLFCELLGAQLNGDSWPLDNDPDGVTRARACEIGFAETHAGEASVWQALETLLARARRRNRSPAKVFGALHLKHEYRLPWPGHAPFRALLARFVAENMPWFRTTQTGRWACREGD